MNRVICLLQVRMASGRLPGKALSPLGGQPILQRVIRRFGAARRVDEVVVATSSEPSSDPVAEWVLAHPDAAGGKPLGLYRGPENDCLGRFLMAARKYPAQIYLRATGDNPLVDIEMISRLVELLEETDCDYTRCEGAMAKGLMAECFWARTLEAAVQLETAKFERETITFAMYNSPEIFKFCEAPVPESLRRPYRLTLDTDKDYEMFKRIYDHFEPGDDILDASRAIAWLDENPQVVAINADVEQRAAQQIDW